MDNWKHRSIGMKCKSCMWFVEKTDNGFSEKECPQTERSSVGRCRRHSPTMTGFPVVWETDWCGDHKLDEQKIIYCVSDNPITVSAD